MNFIVKCDWQNDIFMISIWKNLRRNISQNFILQAECLQTNANMQTCRRHHNPLHPIPRRVPAMAWKSNLPRRLPRIYHHRLPSPHPIVGVYVALFATIDDALGGDIVPTGIYPPNSICFIILRLFVKYFIFHPHIFLYIILMDNEMKFFHVFCKAFWGSGRPSPHRWFSFQISEGFPTDPPPLNFDILKSHKNVD